MQFDQLKITVLDDGTIKVETDEVGTANHVSADKLMALLSQLAGGETKTTRKPKAHSHGQMFHTH